MKSFQNVATVEWPLIDIISLNMVSNWTEKGNNRLQKELLAL